MRTWNFPLAIGLGIILLIVSFKPPKNPWYFDGKKVVPADTFSFHHFPKPISFRHSQFDSVAIFDSAVFADSANFAHAIFQKPAYFLKTRFDGYCHFTGACLNDTVYYNGSVFHCPANFDSATFQRLAVFENCTFTDSAHFNHLLFESKASFGGSKWNFTEFVNSRFRDTALFDSMRFDSRADFDSTHFYRLTEFFDDTFSRSSFFHATFDSIGFLTRSKFNDFADFDSTWFMQGAVFNGCVFDSAVDFHDALFGDSVFFTNTRFKDTAWFNFTHLKTYVCFDSAKFDRWGFFYGLRLNDKTSFSFYKTVLPDTLDFSFNPKITNEIDLTEADFSDSTRYDGKRDKYLRPHNINLVKTDIAKIRLDYLHFKLLIPDSADNKKVSDDEKEALYEAVLHNFDVHGQKESYRLLDIEYQHFKWTHSSWRWPISWLPLIWWNYGYDKEIIFLWTIGLLVLFWAINYYYLDVLNSKVYTIAKIPSTFSRGKIRKADDAASRRHYLRMRIWYSFVYTATVFFTVTLKFENLRFTYIWKTVYFLLIYVLGLLCIAYIANFVLQK